MANINGQSSRSWETLLLPSWHRGAHIQSTLLVFMRLPLWFLSPELITFPHIAPFNQAPARRASVCERSKRKTLHVQSASSQSTWPSKSARSPSQGRLLRWVSMSWISNATAGVESAFTPSMPARGGMWFAFCRRAWSSKRLPDDRPHEKRPGQSPANPQLISQKFGTYPPCNRQWFIIADRETFFVFVSSSPMDPSSYNAGTHAVKGRLWKNQGHLMFEKAPAPPWNRASSGCWAMRLGPTIWATCTIVA